ncbi:hypothetical protein H6761_01550 [Candidatus Nomurabacteria bacterium]|nr:hypothetical protein [Candidatus Nomurabacteria bacterium]
MSVNFSWPIYGHQKQIKFLQNSLNSSNLANAYLFYGAKGLGKKMIAHHFAMSLFCQSQEARPCQKCQICHHVDQETWQDFYSLGKNPDDLSAENIKIFLGSLSLSSATGTPKLAIIEQVEKLNLHAANALLKVIEEPPKNTTIILIADSIDYLPATVISRCQLLKFQALDKRSMAEWLDNFSLAEIEKETVLNLSFGKPGRALSFMADNLNNFKEKCDWLFKLLDSETLSALQIIDAWFGALKKENTELKVSELGEETVQYLDLLELFWRDILWSKLERKVLNVLYQKELKELAIKYSYPDILKNLLSINKIKKQLRENVSPQVLWENLALNFKS